MSILVPVTEESNRQGALRTPVSKLYGIPHVSLMRSRGSKTVLFIGGVVLEERLVSQDYATLDPLFNSGYSDFLLPLNVIGTGGNINDTYPYKVSLRASNIVEIYEQEEDPSNSVVRYRDNEKKDDKLYIVDESINDILSLSTGINSFSIELNQSQARTLSSSNGGYGAEILPVLPINNIYDVRSARFVFKEDAASAIKAGEIWLYSSSGSQFVDTTLARTLIAPSTDMYEPRVGKAGSDLPRIGELGSADSLYLWTTLDWDSFIGSIVVEVDYRVVNLSQY